MKRSFDSLNPQEALAVAISIEQRNAEVYQRFAEMFIEFADGESRAVAAVFYEMAIEEQGHRDLLEQKYTQRFGNDVCALTEEDLVELIEVPKLHESDVFSDDQDVAVRDRALQVALQAELSARQFYAALADQTVEEPLRQLYRELSATEEEHVAFLEKKLAVSVEENSNLKACLP